MADRFRPRDRRRAHASGWQEVDSAVPLEDVEAAAELAREAASPFGYKRPASRLLARFDGDPARATAALALSGIAADPPLTTARPGQLVQLHQQRVDAPPPADEPAELMPRRPSWAMRVAARNAPSGPVSREGRFRAGAIGLLALVALLIAVVLLRGAIGSPDDRGGTTAPAATDAAQIETTPATATPATTTPASGTTAVRPAAAAPSPRKARPRTVRLRVVPTETSYICVVDGRGRTLWEGMRTGPYEVRGRKLTLRVGVATMRVTVDGRALPINSAPSVYELTPGGVRGVPDDRPLCSS